MHEKKGEEEILTTFLGVVNLLYTSQIERYLFEGIQLYPLEAIPLNY